MGAAWTDARRRKFHQTMAAKRAAREDNGPARPSQRKEGGALTSAIEALDKKIAELQAAKLALLRAEKLLA